MSTDTICPQSVPDTTNNVVETDESSIIEVPYIEGQEENVKREIADLQQKFSELVSKEFNIPIQQILNCAPKNIIFKLDKDNKRKSKDNLTTKKKSKKTKKYTTNNWEEVNEKQDLKCLKASELKDILLSKQLSASGSKSNLIDRVWGILHPTEAPNEPEKKKRGRPKGSSKKTKELAHIIEDSQGDETDGVKEVEISDDLETLISNSVNLDLINSNDKESGAKEFIVIESKGWVFESDDEGNLEWIGIISECKQYYTPVDNPPQELEDLYS